MRSTSAIAAFVAIVCLAFQAGTLDSADAGWRKARPAPAMTPVSAFRTQVKSRRAAYGHARRPAKRLRGQRYFAPPRPAPVLGRIAQNRPSSRAIEKARRSKGLPASANPVNVRLIKRNGQRYWRIIFLDGIRQVPVDVPARR